MTTIEDLSARYGLDIEASRKLAEIARDMAVTGCAHSSGEALDMLCRAIAAPPSWVHPLPIVPATAAYTALAARLDAMPRWKRCLCFWLDWRLQQLGRLCYKQAMAAGWQKLGDSLEVAP